MNKRYPEYKDSGVEWIGEIPEKWEPLRLRYITKFVYGDSLSTENRIEGEVSVCGSNGVVGTHIKANTKNPVIIIGRKGSFGKVNFFNDAVFAIDTTYFVDNTATQQNIRWLYYLLSILRLDSISKDSAVPGLSREDAYDNYVPICLDFEEQTQIADYLDKETSKIDTLIEKKQRLIELLKEQRTAIINQAVTKGLDPTVPMKDSGVEWIGEIPEHWNLCGLKKYIKSVVDYRGRTPHKTEHGVFLITGRNIKNGKIYYSLSQEFTSQEEYEKLIKRGKPQIGDVLFTTEAPLGEVANVDKEKVALAQRIIKFRGRPEYLNNYFLKYWILSHSFQNDLQRYSTGSTALGIKSSKLNFLKIVLPPVSEQKSIVKNLDGKVIKFNYIISNQLHNIELLKEYRQSLISDVVTGKIDVRDWNG